MNNSVLVEILEDIYQLQIDMKYAGVDNLSGRVIYPNAKCFLHSHAASCLSKASQLARQAGLRLRIYDAFRPQYVQNLLWDALPNSHYVRDPRLGSNHSRGVAIDLTLLDSDGTPMNMGTAFDTMDERSHHFYPNFPVEVQLNRLLLLGIMLGAGFRPIPTEWWHFELPNASDYPLLKSQKLRI